MKRILPILLAAFILIEGGTFAVDAYNPSDIILGETQEYRDLITRLSCHYANTFIMDQKPYLAVAPGGAWLYIIDILEEKLYQKLYCDKLGYSAIAIEVSPNTGDLYIGSQTSGGVLYHYSIQTKSIEEIGSLWRYEVNAILNIVFDEADNLYLGCYPVGKVMKYTKATKTFTDLGTIFPAPAQHCYVAYSNNTLFCATNTETNKLKKINLSTGEVIEIDPPAQIGENSSPYRGIRTLNQRYLAVPYNVGDPYTNSAKMYTALYDLFENRWADVISDTDVWRFAPATAEGYFYYCKASYLYEYNLNTLTETKRLSTMVTMRASDNLIEYPHPDYPGKSLVNWVFSGGFSIYSLSQAKYKYVTVADSIITAVGSPMHSSIAISPEGKVYAGESQGMKAFEYDTITDEKKLFHLSEPSGMCVIGDKVYFVCYPGAVIYILDTTKPYSLNSDSNNPNNNPRIWGSLGQYQNRGVTVIDAGGKVAIGAYASVGRGGGALSIFDPETEEAVVYPDLCEDFTPIAMAYRDGLLYIGYSATTEGGLPNHDSTWQPDSRIVVFDMETRETVKTVIPKVEGFSEPITIIKAMIFGEDGLLWCSYDGLVFALNPETLETEKSVLVGPIGTYNGKTQVKPDELKQDAATGFLFLSNPGTVIDPETLSYFSLGQNYMQMGPDGNLYGVIPGNSGGFYRILVNRNAQVEVLVEAGEGGTVIFSGENQVQAGETFTITATPNPGYEIYSIRFNGVPVVAYESGEYTYTTPVLRKDAVIQVSFQPKSAIPQVFAYPLVFYPTDCEYAIAFATARTEISEYKLIEHGMVISKTNPRPEIGEIDCQKAQGLENQNLLGQFGIKFIGAGIQAQNTYYVRPYGIYIKNNEEIIVYDEPIIIKYTGNITSAGIVNLE